MIITDGSHYLSNIVGGPRLTASCPQGAELPHPYAIRTGNECMAITSRGRRISYHLSSIINVCSGTPVAAQSPKVPYAPTLRISDKNMSSFVSCDLGISCHLPPIIYARSPAIGSPQSPQILSHAIRRSDKSMHPLVWIAERAHHLPGIVDV